LQAFPALTLPALWTCSVFHPPPHVNSTPAVFSGNNFLSAPTHKIVPAGLQEKAAAARWRQQRNPFSGWDNFA
jgi:hypothetical protein